jgi:hypothetical protein
MDRESIRQKQMIYSQVIYSDNSINLIHGRASSVQIDSLCLNLLRKAHVVHQHLSRSQKLLKQCTYLDFFCMAVQGGRSRPLHLHSRSSQPRCSLLRHQRSARLLRLVLRAAESSEVLKLHDVDVAAARACARFDGRSDVPSKKMCFDFGVRATTRQRVRRRSGLG